VDVAVNNAGIAGFEQGMVAHDTEHARLENWRVVHRINLDGTSRLALCDRSHESARCRLDHQHLAAFRPCRHSDGDSLSRVEGRHTQSHQDCRTVLRAAGIDHSLQLHIHPTAILTPLWEPALGTSPNREARMSAFAADTPLKRFGLPDEVAAVAIMRALDEPST